MLQYRAVEQGTLDILRQLMAVPELGSFYLAGGTALAMYRGHRMSEGLRLAGIEDIMAMKISAIMKRAVKKDFFDIAELLREYSVQDFIDAYQKKYPNQQLLISVPQAMTYFGEAEESETPVSLVDATWDSVKRQIQTCVQQYLS